MKRLLTYGQATKTFIVISILGISLTSAVLVQYYKNLPETKTAKYIRIEQSQFKRSMKVIDILSKREIANAIYIDKHLVLTNKHVCENAFQRQLGLQSGDDSKIYKVDEVLIDDTGTDLCVMTAIGLKRNLPVITLSGTPLITTDKITMAGFTYRYTGVGFMAYGRSYGNIIEEIVFNVNTWDDIARQEYYNKELRAFDDTYLTNLPIQPGCSGSAVYNIDGELVGVVNAVIADKGGIFIKEINVYKFLKSLNINFNVNKKEYYYEKSN